MLRFKLESENGLFDVYEENAEGEHTVKHEDKVVRCTLVAWDLVPEGLEHLPTFQKYQPVVEKVAA